MDSYKERTMAIRKCANYAAQNDFTVFAMFDGGMCRTGPTANLMYSKGGPSEKCTHTGTGSEDASNVYSFERGNSNIYIYVGNHPCYRRHIKTITFKMTLYKH